MDYIVPSLIKKYIRQTNFPILGSHIYNNIGSSYSINEKEE